MQRPRALALALVALGLPACQPADEDNPTPELLGDGGSPAPDYGAPDARPDAVFPEARVRLNEVDCRGSNRVELVESEGVGGRVAGWILADERGHRQAVSASVGPGGRLDLTLDFRVDCGRTRLALLDPAGQEVEALVPALGAADTTWGRLPDGTGDFTATLPTPGAPNRAPVRAPAELYGLAAPVALRLTVPPDSRQLLEQGSEVVLDATLVRDQDPPRPVGLRLAGRDGRWRPLSMKPSFDLRFDHPDPAGRLAGSAGVELSGATLDAAVLTAHVGARLLAYAGLPAPATGFAEVWLDDAPLGLYLVQEPYDAAFAARHHPSTWALYRALARDLTANQVDRLDFVAGERSTRPVLRWLVGVLDGPQEAGLLAATEDRLDWPQIWRAFAVERWMQSGDGYAGVGNSFALHIEATDRVTLWPEGLDRIFRGPSSPFARGGRLFNACLDDPGCRAGYERTFVEVARALAAAVPTLDAELAGLAVTLASAFAADARTPHGSAQFAERVAALRAALAQRVEDLRREVACLAEGADGDGDGWRCSADCDDTDPAVYPAAGEICGDGRDNDCDGQVDVAPDCPPCQPRVRDGRTYAVCTGALDWPTARTRCFERGAELARVDAWGENRWLTLETRALSYQNYWIGLNDRVAEGAFEWDDLSLPGETFWAEGQPDNGGVAAEAGDEDRAGEHCVELRADDARWNDLTCAAERAYVCEPACESPEDADSDGFTNCGADCDDADAAVSPGAEEICDNDVDEDCDGVVDEGEGCDPCRARTYEGRAYLFCPQPATYDEALADCAARGATLVEVEDAAENTWLYATGRRVQYQRYWIALTHRAETGVWRWESGARPAFTVWTRGEPNHSGNNEFCGHLWESIAGWNDIPCDSRHGYICEGPAP